MDLPGTQRVVGTLAAVLLVLAIVIGLWPVSVTVAGGTSYSCGSGFDHDQHAWVVDSRGLAAGPQELASSSATPRSACPNAVYGHRTLAIVLGALAILGGVIALVLGPPFDPSMRRRARPSRSRTTHSLP